MANKHFGNLADVFKHIALSEILAWLKPKEYWESHAGSAFYEETAAAIPAERVHGAHQFMKLAADFDVLRRNLYTRTLTQHAKDGRPARIPGSPCLALSQLGEGVRRYLFCDLEAESLVSIMALAKEMRIAETKVECVQDDGAMLLRGAGLTLSEQWTRATLAFIDPYELEAAEGGISPLELWCELGNRGIGAILWYGFHDEAQRAELHRRFTAALEKARLLTRKSNGFEGSLKVQPAANLGTLWGFGLVTINIGEEATAAVDKSLRALEAAYARATLGEGGAGVAGSGAWKYSSRAQ